MKDIHYDIMKEMFRLSKTRSSHLKEIIDNYSNSYISHNLLELVDLGYVERTSFGVYEITLEGRKQYMEEKQNR